MLRSAANLFVIPGYSFLTILCLAKTRSGREINSLHNFLNPPICYDCSLCSAFSASRWEPSSGFFDHGKTCSWRTWHFVSSSVCSIVETGGPNWPSGGLTALASTRVFGANDTHRLGIIGAGQRMRGLLDAADKGGPYQIVAVSEVYAPHRDAIITIPSSP